MISRFPDLSHPLATADDESKFDRVLIHLVEEYLTENADARLAELLESLPSVYPAAVVRAIGTARGVKTKSRQSECSNRAKRQRHIFDSFGREHYVPPPHPLDADWRFTSRTADSLLQKVATFSSPTSLSIALGTPSILEAKNRAGLNSRMILIDANSLAVQACPQRLHKGDVLQCNVLVDPLPSVAADAIVVDPPWYYDEMAAFLWAARYMCRVGGRVLLSTPKVGTRPAILSELERLRSWSHSLGFVIEGFEPDLIEYESPFFEWNALRAEGVSDYPHNWRRADLLVLRALHRSSVCRPRCSSHRKWQEVIIGEMRLRILEGTQNSFRDPSLRSLAINDSPVSVSRRDSRKRDAKVWTSGNRVFDCSGPRVLLWIARALEMQQSPKAAVELGLARPLTRTEMLRVAMAVRQLRRLAAVEKQEAHSYRIATRNSPSRQYFSSGSARVEFEAEVACLAARFTAPANAGIHLAVFVEPFLRFVIEGRKTIESRFSLRRGAPFKQVDVGDLLLLKKSGGPIIGSCRVAETWFYVLEPSSWTHIRTEFAQAICAEHPTFWSQRAEAKYVTLLRIEDVRTFAPISFPKKDRRGWVVLRKSAKNDATTCDET